MGMSLTVTNPLNRKKKISGAYANVTSTKTEIVRIDQQDGIIKLGKLLTAVIDTYESEEAYRAGSGPCANALNLQLRDDAEMVIQQEAKNSITGEVLSPAVRGPKLDDFYAAVDSARQDGDRGDDLAKRGVYSLLKKTAVFKDATAVVEDGQKIVSVEFPTMAK